jgi:hypothetical protein
MMAVGCGDYGLSLGIAPRSRGFRRAELRCVQVRYQLPDHQRYGAPKKIANMGIGRSTGRISPGFAGVRRFFCPVRDLVDGEGKAGTSNQRSSVGRRSCG